MNIKELHRTRIKTDYEEMLTIPANPVLSWKATKGIAPYIEEYLLTIKVRTYSAPGKIMNECKVRVSIPENYPTVAPVAYMEGTKVFHPNWFTSGKYCGGLNHPTESLKSYIMRMIQTLQYDPAITNPRSPANPEANSWFLKNKHLFPSDKQPLPIRAMRRGFTVTKRT